MRAPVMHKPLSVTDTVDWGVIPTMIEGESRTSGKVLHKGPDGQSECGLWICTPGKWECHVTKDEFCHFLEGRCTYVHESGEVSASPKYAFSRGRRTPAWCTAVHSATHTAARQ
ncbi:MAG: cupin domain-containing protein, partial [Pseudomonadota bacterium]|nr:cupin domain-containing protein [Pseudomonadota bacterium]